MGDDGGKSCLRYGCFGCAAIVAFIILIVGITVAVGMLRVKQEQVEAETITGQISGAASAESAETDTTDTIVELPAGRGTGHVILDLRHAEFNVSPAQTGEPLRVEARYDVNSFSLEERFSGDETDWTHEIEFARKGSWMIAALRQMMGGDAPKVRVFLPPDTPYALTLRIAEGGAMVDIGGLWLTDVDFSLDKGGVQLEVAEPLREPVGRMSIRAAMGGFELGSLGNASPAQLDIDFSMGGAEMDLRGRWIQDSDITINTRMSGGVVRLPRNVRIEGLASAGVTAPDQPEIELPTLRFSASSEMGELEILD